MAVTPSGRYVTRNVSLEPDQDAWLQEEGRRQSGISISAVVRQILRERMDAEQPPKAEGEAA